MSFWSWSTGPTLKHALFDQGAPKPLPCPVPIPLKENLWRAPVQATRADAAEIVEFLGRQYDSGSALDYSTSELSTKTILIVRSIRGRIIGTISSRPVGTINGSDFKIIYIDLFCVDAAYRESGVGRDLLFAIYALNFPDPRTVFIKEGAALPITVPPIRSSYYKWRRVPADETFNGVSIMTFREFAEWAPADTLYNVPTKTECVVFNYCGVAVAVFAPAHQRYGGERMIWMTGYVDKGPVDMLQTLHGRVSNNSEVALRNLSAAAARHFNAPCVWVDGEYVSAPNCRLVCEEELAPTWTKDGAYHIYAFNWNPGIFYNGRPVLFI
jgi:hypothetical protein